MIVGVVMSIQAKVSGNLEYSLTAVSRYLFLETNHRGLLKSIFNLSNGCVALLRCACAGL